MRRDQTKDLLNLEVAIQRWGDTIWRLVCCRLRNRGDAEDAFQNTFLALYRARPRFESEEHQKAWLLRTACNCCAQIHRKRKERPEGDINEIAAAELREEEDAHQELRDALAHLTDKQRIVVHLFYFEGYATEEIARITGERPATVRSHLYRARQALRIELEQEGADHA